MATLECIAELTGHMDRVWYVSWSPNGDYLVSCSGDKSIRVWSIDLESPENCMCQAILNDAHEKSIRRCAWHPNSDDLFACSSFDGAASVWARTTPTTWVCAATLESHESEVKGVAWSGDGEHIATSGRDKVACVWDCIDDGEIRDFECNGVLRGHTQDVKVVTWNPIRPILYSGSYDTSIREWQNKGDDWVCTNVLEGHSSTVWDVTTDPTGERLASCSDDSSIIFWGKKFDPDTKQGVWTADRTITGLHDGRPIYSIAWSLTGLVATGAGDNTVSIYRENEETHEWSEIVREIHKDSDVNCVAWCPNPENSNIIASCGDDGVIKIWKLTITN